MTRFDPFAMDSSAPADSPGGTPSPDDMLFAEGATSLRNAPPADSSWGLLDADVGSLLPGAQPAGLDFGADVLNEAPVVAAPAAAPVRPRPAAAPRPASGGPKPSRPGAPEPRHEVGAARPVAAAPAPAPTYVARKPSSVGRVGGRSALTATVVPALCFTLGGGTSAWLYGMEQNVMMAAIVAALTLVGTGFARVLLRG